MSHQVIDMRCPGCGAPTTTAETTCKYCFRPIVISTFNSVYSMSLSDVNQYTKAYRQELNSNPDNGVLNNSIAMCYLKLHLYDKAFSAFEKAIENDFDNSETYFYAAISLLNGKKPFLHQRPTIDKLLELLNAGIMIEPRGIYYYFLAYIKYDYFARKYLNTNPNYQELLQTAEQVGYSETDKERLCSLLGIDINL